MRGRDSYNFTDRGSSKKGVFSVILSFLSFFMLVFFMVRAASQPITVAEGLSGIYAFVAGILAFSLSFYSFRKEETRQGWNIAGMILSLLVIGLCIFLVFFGM